MRYLLDTQLVVWWMTESERMPKQVPALLAEEGCAAFVSRVSQWELAIKISTGKMTLDLARVCNQVVPDGFEWLEINSEHLFAVSTLPLHPDHKDPFDRLLAAQSLTEPLILLTTDPKLARYGSTIRVV